MAVATSRDDEIRLIWTENQWLYLVAGFLGGILFCLLFQLSITNFPELVINLLPEAAGIFITVTVIDALNRRRDERNAIKQLKAQLVREAGSNVNDVAKNAVHQLRKYGWLEGNEGLLVGVNLEAANLRGAELEYANLQRANLELVNLEAANLWSANLKGASLGMAKLKQAILVNANLQRVFLGYAKLQGATLLDANMEEADFGQSDFSEIFDETTILPDGTNWTPETDMTKFTNPKSADSK